LEEINELKRIRYYIDFFFLIDLSIPIFVL